MPLQQVHINRFFASGTRRPPAPSPGVRNLFVSPAAFDAAVTAPIPENLEKLLCNRGLQLKPYYWKAYNEACEKESTQPPSLLAPNAEQLQQLNAATRNGNVEWLTFKTLAEALGWIQEPRLTTNNSGVVNAVTKFLLHRRLMDPVTNVTHWYRKQGGDNCWHWPTCMREMRIAAAFVHRLHAGGQSTRDLTKHVGDSLSCLP